MTYQNERGAICYKRSTQDGHGGRAEEHRAEMQEIAQEEIRKAIPEIQKEAYHHAMSDLLSALKADVTTVVNIQLDSGEEIFHDSRTKQFLLNTVYNTIISNLQTHYVLD